MRRLLPYVLLAGASVLASCGGGGGAGGGALPNQPAPKSAANKQAPISVTFPGAKTSASQAKKPHFLSASTASFTLQVTSVNGSTPNPQPTPLKIQLSDPTYCTTNANGVTCNINFNVPIASSVTITIITYDANGNSLGQGSIGPIDTTQPTIPPQPVSVGGVLASIQIAPALQSAAADGAIHTLSFFVSGKDQDGNTILPPGNYPTPITFSIANDANHALSISPTTIASPGANGSTTVTLTYTSTKALSTVATINANGGTGVTASTNFAPIIFSPTSLPGLLQGGSSQTFTVSEPGYAGAFSLTGTSSVATVSCAPVNCTPTSAGGSITVTVAPGTPGTESVSVNDVNGGFANVPITVTGASGSGPTVGNATVYSYTTAAGGKNFGITVGPDAKTIWIVDQANMALSAVASPAACTSSTCAITAAPMPVSSPPVNGLQKIVAASDGKLYVQDYGDDTAAGDPGNFFQLTCTPSPASCTGSQLPYWDFYDNQNPAAPSDMIVGPNANVYAAISDSTSLDTAIAWEPLPSCCASGSYKIDVGPAPASVNQLAYDASTGLLWWTDKGNGNVGFVSTSACLVSCTALELPSGISGSINYGPRGGIAPGPPRNPLARRRFVSGTPFTTPLNGIIVAGGSVFIAEPSANRIDQLNPAVWSAPCSGASCTSTPIYPVVMPAGTTNASAVPMNFTIGPDGNVWFTDTSGYVGFIAMNTCATGCKAYEYHVGGAPWGIVAGPDGDVWFTDSSTNKIGKVVLQ